MRAHHKNFELMKTNQILATAFAMIFSLATLTASNVADNKTTKKEPAKQECVDKACTDKKAEKSECTDVKAVNKDAKKVTADAKKSDCCSGDKNAAEKAPAKVVKKEAAKSECCDTKKAEPKK